MGRILWIYFFKASALAFLLVAFGLTLLFILFDLVSEFEDVGSAGYSAFDAILVVAMQLPNRLVEQSAYCSMLGVFLTLAKLSRTNELTAMLTTGVSRAQILIATLTVVSIFFVAVSAIEYVARPAYQEALKFRSSQLSDRMNAIRGRGLWLYENDEITNIGTLLDGKGPQNIRIYTLGKDNLLDQYLSAKQADLADDNSWVLQGVVAKDYRTPGRAQLRRFDTRPWGRLTNPEELLIKLPIDSLTLTQLYQQSRDLGKSGDDTTAIDNIFWSRLSLPFQGIAFSFLAAIFSLRRIQRGELSRHMLIGIMTALTLYIGTRMLTNAALIAGITPPFATMLPVILVFLAGSISLARSP